MTKSDLYWCLGGLVIGLLIATSTLLSKHFVLNSFNMGQLTGNVLGGVLIMWLVGRIVRRLGRKS
jgi:hypothetical protein